MKIYQKIFLNKRLPKYNLKEGDIATFIDTVPHPAGGEEGYVLEVFNALGESIDVVVVPQSAVTSLNENQILAVRTLVRT